jgi:hypothetical protein
MPSNPPTFKTNDWQWFLQDIDAQLELQMHPDQNEIERHQVEKRAMKGESPVASQANNSPVPAGSERGKRTGYGTFFAEVSKAGTVNGGDDDEEMPILASSKSSVKESRSRR